MKHTASLLPLNSQKPFSQLVISLFSMLLVSLVLLVLTIILGRIFFGEEVKEISTGLSELTSKQLAYLKFTQALQHVSMFLIPSLIAARLISEKPLVFLRIQGSPGLNIVLLTIVLAIVIVPLNGYLGVLNSKLELPSWLGGIESWMKAKESEANHLTTLLIESTGIKSLIVNIIILAILPAFGEEFLFRGILQRIFGRMFKSHGLAILLTAILFSASHLQFYGFLPRLLLGLAYGYIFYWTRSMWVPVLAHFINNLVPVILAHTLGWEPVNESVTQISENEQYYILIPVALSALLMFIIFDMSKGSNSSAG